MGDTTHVLRGGGYSHLHPNSVYHKHQGQGASNTYNTLFVMDDSFLSSVEGFALCSTLIKAPFFSVILTTTATQRQFNVAVQSFKVLNQVVCVAALFPQQQRAAPPCESPQRPRHAAGSERRTPCSAALATTPGRAGTEIVSPLFYP